MSGKGRNVVFTRPASAGRARMSLISRLLLGDASGGSTARTRPVGIVPVANALSSLDS